MPSISATGLNLTATEGVGSSGTVATFNDTYSPYAYDYTATIAWGDGSYSDGTVSATAGTNNFAVTGTHAYATVGTYALAVHITDAGGASTDTPGWSSVASLNQGTSTQGTARDGQGRIYAIGGYSSGDLSYVERYDPVAASWSQVAGLLTARTNTAGASDAAGRIYAIGGYNTSKGVLSSVERYDPATNSWSYVAPLNTGRYEAATATDAQGRIYAIGGYTYSGVQSSVERYDPATNSWSYVASLGTARTYAAAATDAQGRIYAIGGYHNYGILPSVERYDPDTDSWSYVASLSAAVEGQGGATDAQGRIYALGGQDSDGNLLSSVERYDPATDSWSHVASLSSPRFAPGAASDLQGRIYAIGGSGTSGAVTTVERLQMETPVATVADAPLAVAGVSLHGVEGALFNGTVATFSDANPNAVATDFSATITWEDGSISAGSVVAAQGGGFAVQGSHTFAEEGSGLVVTVAIADIGGSTATVLDSATVADAPLSAAGVSVSATEGAAFTAPVATFTDADPGGTASDFSATITWGDGHTSTGTVASNGAGGFVVTGSHTYAEEGAAPITVTITDAGSSQALATTSATVKDAALKGAKKTITATAGTPFSGIVATFTDGSPNGKVSDFSATILWGDGHVSAGTVVINGRKGFAVLGSNTYETAGTYIVRVTIADVGGSRVVVKSTATVAAAPMGAGFSASPVGGAAGTPGLANLLTRGALAQGALGRTGVRVSAHPATLRWDTPLGADTAVASSQRPSVLLDDHVRATAGADALGVAIEGGAWSAPTGSSDGLDLFFDTHGSSAIDSMDLMTSPFTSLDPGQLASRR